MTSNQRFWISCALSVPVTFWIVDVMERWSFRPDHCDTSMPWSDSKSYPDEGRFGYSHLYKIEDELIDNFSVCREYTGSEIHDRIERVFGHER